MCINHKVKLWQLRLLTTRADASESSKPQKSRNTLKRRNSCANCANPVCLFMLENVLISHKRFHVVNIFIFNHY